MVGVVPGVAHAQGAITNGTTHTGTIVTGGEIDTWTFAATFDDSITIMAGEVLVDGQPDAIFRPFIRLMNPNGVQIASNLGTNAALIDVRAALTGTYTVLVSAAETGQIRNVDYILTLARTAGPYTISAGDEGGPLTNGANHAGTIGVGDMDIWTFAATINDSITLSIGEVLVGGQPDPSFRPWFRLRGPDGDFLASQLGTNAAEIDLRAPLTGIYTVLVTAAEYPSQVSPVNYVLTLARTAGPYTIGAGDEGGALTNGANHAGTIGVGDLDAWTLQASINDSITISIGEVLVGGQPDPAFRPWIRLRGPDGAFLGAEIGTNAAEIELRAPVTGTFTVLVAAAEYAQQVSPVSYVITTARTAGPYTISPGDQGGAMVNGGNHPGTIGVGDMDVWTLQASINDSVTISIGEVLVSGQPDPAFRPWIRLRGPDGAFLGSQIGTNAAEIDMRVPLTGTYTVLVTAAEYASQTNPVNYVMTAARTPGPYVTSPGDDGGQMTNTVEHVGAIPVGDMDVWTFTATQGTTVTVNVSEILIVGQPDPQFRPWIRLRAPDGTFLGSAIGTDSTYITIAAPVTGSYTVLVTAAEYASQLITVGYKLSVIGAFSPERITVGLGQWSGSGGWFNVRRDIGAGFGGATWGQVPWAGYSAIGGAVHVAAGDLDGDGLDELVAGLGPGGGGWVAIFDDAAHGFALLKWIQVSWTVYNATNGETWPAVGDIDGDGRAEIVVGLGAGSAGWVQIFDDLPGNAAHIAWRQVNWAGYTGGGGGVHPAVGNVDGDGESEIVLGLGQGSSGWVEILTGATAGFSHQSWVQVGWSTYAQSNGTTYPAAGDLDGDGRAELVLGLGSGGGGWVEVLEDGAAAFAHASWLRTSWPTYNAAGNGETHPAVGNVDGDSRAEIVLGLADVPGAGGWFEILDDAAASYASLAWRNVEWAAFTAAGGSTFPAVGRFQ